ncbi:MAG: VacJ family lipoprotein [Ferrimonas sp.]
MGKYALSLLLVIMMPLHSSAAEYEGDKRDPFESFNRVMWDFNYKVVDPVVRPVAHAYDDYVPQLVRNSVGSFTDNLKTPFSTVNHLLRGQPKSAGWQALRFTINSTVGILGLFDVASDMGLPHFDEEEFGAVLFTYGVPNGPYLMLPFFGPTTVRHGLGSIVDGSYFPYTSMNFDQQLGYYVVDGIETRASIRDQEGLLNNAFDSYSFVKEAFFQMQAHALYYGEPPQNDEESDDLSDYLDEIDF